MKKLLAICLASLLTTGCASIAGSNNSRSHILYEHRTPVKKTAIIEGAKHGILEQALGFKSSDIFDNAGEISLGTAEIVKAIAGTLGFPYVIIPQIISSTMKGARYLKEETADQEVSKLYAIDGMLKIEASLPDSAKINATFEEGYNGKQGEDSHTA